MQLALAPQTFPVPPGTASIIFANNQGDKTHVVLSPSHFPTSPSKAIPGAFSLSHGELEIMQRWELAFILLPVRDCTEGEHYTLDDILPVVGHVKMGTLYLHARNVFPDYEGRYKLTLIEARKLVRYCYANSRKSFSRDELLEQIRATRDGLLKRIALTAEK